MSISHHAADNVEETLFQFDPFDSLPSDLIAQRSSHDPSEHLDVDSTIVHSAAVIKGKERSMPVPILTTMFQYDHDLMASPNMVASPSSYRDHGSPSSSAAFSPSSFSFLSPDDFNRGYHFRSSSVESLDQQTRPTDSETSTLASPSSPKGKERASPPHLPPLSFSHIKLDCGHDFDPTPEPSRSAPVYQPIDSAAPPISGTTVPGPVTLNDSISTVSPLLHFSSGPTLAEDPRKPITRRRSLSNLSLQLSTPTLNPSKLGPSQSVLPSNLSRQRIKQQETQQTDTSIPGSSISITDTFSQVALIGPLTELEGCSSDWFMAGTPFESDTNTNHTDISNAHTTRKEKTRSKSSPYPISALDYVPVATTDIFQAIPIIVRNYFDLFLPKELQLAILSALVNLHEHDYQTALDEGRISFGKATSSRHRWVGRDKGVRELFKLSRVSKQWQSLVFDGQLWRDLDLRSFPGLPPYLMVRLAQSTGLFTQSLNFAGHVHLDPDNMMDITNELCVVNPHSHMSYTQLTSINLRGCTGLTTRSLHHLLVRSRSLEKLVVKGLGAVTNTTCDILANFCPRLVSLDMGRCSNVNAEGIRSMALAALARQEHLSLKVLRLSGLRHITDSMMRALGRAAPYLEVLDLSYARQLHNSALEAFVACDGYWTPQLDLGVDTVLVSARDLGRESNDFDKLRRRVTRLRHLALSYSVLLTDTGCSNLTYSIPQLEYLELGGIGADMKDEGLIRLLSTTPDIRRLDLEDATDITDALLVALTPTPALPTDGRPSSTNNTQPKQTGHALERLTISYASLITDNALLSLVRNCPHLTVLEADNTRIGPGVLREFVRLSQQRKLTNAKLVAIDCRGIGENLVKELSACTRPRLGWRAYEARKLHYLDARDEREDELRVGQDECDEGRVVLKTFYSWQTVDAVRAAREKRRRMTTRRAGSESSVGTGEEGGSVVGAARWWSPGGRRASGRRSASPILPDLSNDGCRTM